MLKTMYKKLLCKVNLNLKSPNKILYLIVVFRELEHLVMESKFKIVELIHYNNKGNSFIIIR